MTTHTALLYGNNLSLLTPIPALLSRAGFCVTVISNNTQLKTHRFVKNFIYAATTSDVIKTAQKQLQHHYNFIAACDEECPRAILHSSFSIKEKLQLLPVIHEKNFSHLYSKIELSILLHKYHFPTPPFMIAQNSADMIRAAQALEYPVMLKIDFSAGGAGVLECQNLKDVIFAKSLFFPLLIQKKIEGTLISGGALFLNAELIFFECGECVLAKPHPTGPSMIKRYHPSIDEDPLLQKNLIALGKILGANGFVNFTAIRTEQTYYFIEADMRPNKWIDCSKHYSEDPAKKIVCYFTSTSYKLTPTTKRKEMLLAFAPEVSYFDYLFNRYHARSKYDYYYPGSYFLKKTKKEVVKFIKWLLKRR
ncbi:MAG: hypothetical protein Q8L78_02030 [Coxiellaceae bacterium]|nr:hypothetical protein [Coxiellaceae bacterium]